MATDETRQAPLGERGVRAAELIRALAVEHGCIEPEVGLNYPCYGCEVDGHVAAQ